MLSFDDLETEDTQSLGIFEDRQSNVVSEVLDDEFREIASAKVRTPIGAGNKDTMLAIAAIVREALEIAGLAPSDVAGLGIAVPGPDRTTGAGELCRYAANGQDQPESRPRPTISLRR